ncbi:hypothetical protein DPMN_185650 [Dreissena polymorpha]|uniref:Fibrinogen C-terminal domain-containing protein n=1 Tax=Dreissena polymorpha TaxID=45954 RepID=A0A9D4I7H1_DREPO|nr:hypothetical protein DPMN_185650 [Dreissena polymorpha]
MQSRLPTCYPYDCGSAAPANGVATAPNGTTYQKQATVQCNPGYSLNGSSLIECNATGWNDSVSWTNQDIEVYCEMATGGGGWTVFQRRVNGSVDFYQNFFSYENGFGDVHGEHWLGLKYIYAMTFNVQTELRIDLMAASDARRMKCFQTSDCLRHLTTGCMWTGELRVKQVIEEVFHTTVDLDLSRMTEMTPKANVPVWIVVVGGIMTVHSLT